MFGACGEYCEPITVSKTDQKALLKEREAILEAKLATIRHLMETLDKEESESKKD